MWAAWWTGPPCREPFRRPDAFRGGSRTHEEALEEASRAAGMLLVEIEARWANAWARVLLGHPAFGDTAKSDDASNLPRRVKEVPRDSVWATLGVTREATDAELKRAYRKRALETHPDHGGDPEAFRSLQRAYEEAVRRAARPGRRRASPPR